LAAALAQVLAARQQQNQQNGIGENVNGLNAEELFGTEQIRQKEREVARLLAAQQQQSTTAQFMLGGSPVGGISPPIPPAFGGISPNAAAPSPLSQLQLLQQLAQIRAAQIAIQAQQNVAAQTLASTTNAAQIGGGTTQQLLVNYLVLLRQQQQQQQVSGGGVQIKIEIFSNKLIYIL